MDYRATTRGAGRSSSPRAWGAWLDVYRLGPGRVPRHRRGPRPRAPSALGHLHVLGVALLAAGGRRAAAPPAQPALVVLLRAGRPGAASARVTYGSTRFRVRRRAGARRARRGRRSTRCGRVAARARVAPSEQRPASATRHERQRGHLPVPVDGRVEGVGRQRGGRAGGERRVARGHRAGARPARRRAAARAARADQRRARPASRSRASARRGRPANGRSRSQSTRNAAGADALQRMVGERAQRHAPVRVAASRRARQAAGARAEARFAGRRRVADGGDGDRHDEQRGDQPPPTQPRGGGSGSAPSRVPPRLHARGPACSAAASAITASSTTSTTAPCARLVAAVQRRAPPGEAGGAARRTRRPRRTIATARSCGTWARARAGREPRPARPARRARTSGRAEAERDGGGRGRGAQRAARGCGRRPSARTARAIAASAPIAFQ